MGLAPSVFERCDEGNGVVIGVFHQVCGDIGDVALKAKADPITFADRAFEALIANDHICHAHLASRSGSAGFAVNPVQHSASRLTGFCCQGAEIRHGDRGDSLGTLDKQSWL